MHHTRCRNLQIFKFPMDFIENYFSVQMNLTVFEPVFTLNTVPSFSQGPITNLQISAINIFGSFRQNLFQSRFDLFKNQVFLG